MYTNFIMDHSIISKSFLVQELANHMGWTKKKSNVFINNFFTWIKEQMLLGNRIVLSGFGVFQLNLRKQRRLLHPITQKPFVIPERFCPQFTPADVLLKLLNGVPRS